MAKSFFIAPTAKNAGLTSVSLGLLRALDEIGVRVGFFKPLSQVEKGKQDHSIHFANAINHTNTPDAIHISEAQHLINQGDKGLLMEKIAENFYQVKQHYDVIIIEGIVPTQDQAYSSELNKDVANSLDAEIILLAPMSSLSLPHSAAQLDNHLHTAMGTFSSVKKNIIGCILNKVSITEHQEADDNGILISEDAKPRTLVTSQNSQINQSMIDDCATFNESFKLIGQVPLQPQLQAPRLKDIANEFGLSPISNNKAMDNADLNRRVLRISICARSISNLISALTPGCLIVTPGDRGDVILAACMAAQNGTPIAGMILTGGYQPDPEILALCQPALTNGLPLLITQNDTFETAIQLSSLENKVPLDDLDRINDVMRTVASHLDTEWLKLHCEKERATRLSPSAFRYRLSENARSANKTIVLPEGNEPRTVCAAAICHARNLAKCILIGKPDEIHRVATSQGVTLPDDVQIIDPDQVREKYVQPMTELRKNKGVSPQMALAMLEDNVVLGTMMVALDEVDGLVSGAVNTTANTVRPALQLIKTTANAKVVSSVFFMCLPEQVLVYGDCAINPDPNAEQLADIAIQSADSARAFGIEPKVAMISYSTGQSGQGLDVDKVREATKIAQQKRPDILIDGPLQYDAAAIQSVANKKAPDSPVAGKATVFIFPDLNTGNTTYKAVQRSADVISIGPMLQGLRKPVNDLSRGALVEDIVFTIALTAVQATQH
ncbi:MAG: phosphate acetyltransferase [Oleiphilus sp.]